GRSCGRNCPAASAAGATVGNRWKGYEAGLRAGGAAAAQGRLDVPVGREKDPVITSGLPQLLDELQHRGGTCQLRERLSLRNVTRFITQSFLCTLLGRESSGLIDIMCTQSRIGKHRNLGRLYLERTTADEEVLLLAVGSLHAYFARLEQSQ